MRIEITLLGEDLIELIRSKISQEVSKHGHPGTFEVELTSLHRSFPEGVPLEKSNLYDYAVRAVATPKAP